MVDLERRLTAPMTDAGRGRREKAAFVVAPGPIGFTSAVPLLPPKPKYVDAGPQGNQQDEPKQANGQQADEQCDIQAEHRKLGLSDHLERFDGRGALVAGQTTKKHLVTVLPRCFDRRVSSVA